MANGLQLVKELQKHYEMEELKDIKKELKSLYLLVKMLNKCGLISLKHIIDFEYKYFIEIYDELKDTLKEEQYNQLRKVVVELV